MPRNLVPCEKYCHKCPGKVPLSDPIVITNKAKIVTIVEVVEGRLQYMISIVIAVSCKINIVSHSVIVETFTRLWTSLFFAFQGVTTYCKKCAACGTFYRYQEGAEGLHNFNDRVILTHHFCLFLRNSIQVKKKKKHNKKMLLTFVPFQ